MIISEHEQNTPEWIQERLGTPSASQFSRIVNAKGERSGSRQKYMDELAGEIISGEQKAGYYNKSMEKGHERELENISMYEFNNNVDVVRVGFCWQDEKKMYGASPDGLVGDDGLIECKNAEPHVQIERLRKYTASEHHRQVQGQMLVTGRKWCDVVSYSRGFKPVVVRFERDPVFLLKLKIELMAFHEDLMKLVEWSKL
jgi:hypothetical protein